MDQDEERINQDEMVSNFDRATQKIMQIFNDPIFMNEEGKMELQEVDF